jgi:kynurenine formamidase
VSDEHPTEDEVLGWITSLSNWDRWGADDRLGALNFITTEVRLRAAESVRVGVQVSCAHEIAATPRQDGNPSRLMIATGESLTVPHPERHAAAATDLIQMQIHGHQVTHLDALSHWFWDGSMFNHVPATKVTADRGATELGVESIRGGIVTRGVLLDIAAARGAAWLEPGEAVTPADLEAAEQRQQVAVRCGDAVLLHTGFGRYRQTAAPDAAAPTAWPGWGAACLPWLYEREVAVIGSETSNEVMPNDYPALGRHPIHSVGIAAMGLWLIDNCKLDDLVAACAEYDTSTFLLTLAPLGIRGATGSPINPIALL